MPFDCDDANLDFGSANEVTCPYCGRPILNFEIGNHRDDRPKCSAVSGCKAWKVIGLSRNGGPLLMLVED